MTKLLSLTGLSMVLFFSCTKKVETEPTVLNNSSTPTATTAAILTDPVNVPPSNYQSNSNAFQYNYARVKIIKGMTGQLTRTTVDAAAKNQWHLYLRAQNGKYYHMPGNSSNNISYDYFLKTATSSTINITRGAGPEEIFETVIVLGVNPNYASAFSPAINFDDYAMVKNKLGF
ncbi:hypothetical protein EON73_04935 [bacterium]|nr:MAG: hypothetical protein EON73_04935 [bacterium]